MILTIQCDNTSFVIRFRSSDWQFYISLVNKNRKNVTFKMQWFGFLLFVVVAVVVDKIFENMDP